VSPKKQLGILKMLDTKTAATAMKPASAIAPSPDPVANLPTGPVIVGRVGHQNGVGKPKLELTDAQKAAKKQYDEARALWAKALGKEPAERKKKTKSMGGIAGDTVITLDIANTFGFKSDGDKEFGRQIGTGMTLDKLVALTSWNWVCARFMRGSLKMHGKTFAELVGAAAPAA
jgi:hypothetical protein